METCYLSIYRGLHDLVNAYKACSLFEFRINYGKGTLNYDLSLILFWLKNQNQNYFIIDIVNDTKTL